MCSEVGYEERRLNLIHRIDFGWAVDREDSAKKHKKDTSATTTTSKDATKPWPWKSLVENLQAAHQELSVIIDLINTVCLRSHFSLLCFCTVFFITRYLLELIRSVLYRTR